MNTAFPSLTVEQPSEEAVRHIIGQLERVGLQVMQTFDLQKARTAHADCPCPHHGARECDCQIVVLLVYARDLPPASLIAHGHAGRTWFYLVNTPQQPADPSLEERIMNTLYAPAHSQVDADLRIST
jgi:hypothetical protein